MPATQIKIIVTQHDGREYGFAGTLDPIQEEAWTNKPISWPHEEAIKSITVVTVASLEYPAKLVDGRLIVNMDAEVSGDPALIVTSLPSDIQERINELYAMAFELGDISKIVLWYGDGTFPVVYEFKMWYHGQSDPCVSFGKTPSYTPTYKVVLTRIKDDWSPDKE